MSAEHSIEQIGPEGVEIARYRISAEGRRLLGRRELGGVEITDHPVSGPGRAYRVDSGFHQFGELRAFVEDYLAEASRLDACPMSRQGITAILSQTEDELLTSLLGETA